MYHTVALRKESVDRNISHNLNLPSSPMSLSARRAWIEMIDNITQGVFNLVALRKESVDRNIDTQNFCVCVIVALRKESVDRNFNAMQIKIVKMRRSPQGERG